MMISKKQNLRLLFILLALLALLVGAIFLFNPKPQEEAGAYWVYFRTYVYPRHYRTTSGGSVYSGSFSNGGISPGSMGSVSVSYSNVGGSHGNGSNERNQGDSGSLESDVTGAYIGGNKTVHIGTVSVTGTRHISISCNTGFYVDSTSKSLNADVGATYNGSYNEDWNTKNHYEEVYIYIRPNSYSIYFRDNFKTSSLHSTLSSGYYCYYSLPSSPSKTGYNFAGWFRSTGSNGNGSGTQVTSSSVKTSASNETLYARWTARSYTLTYDPCDGSVSPTSKSVTYDSSYGTLPTPTRSGYDFAGWYTSASGGSRVYSSTTYTTAGNSKIYAHWTPATYTITLNSNAQHGLSVSNGLSSKSVQYTKAVTQITNLPTMKYHTFKGYYTATSGGTQVFDASGNYYQSTYNRTSGQTLYAQWEDIIYTITLDPSGGSPGGTKSLAYLQEYGTLPTPTRFGYDFNNWWTASRGGTQVTSTSTLSEATIDGAKAIYAHWTPKQFTVKANLQGGQITTSNGWLPVDDNNVSNSITFDSTYGSLPFAMKPGYLFKGWYTQLEGGDRITSSSTFTGTVDTLPTTIYAQWIETWAAEATMPERITEDSKTVYLIDSAEDLAWMALQTQTASLSGTFRQTADIDLAGNVWLSIGTESHPFIGNFDGQGYTIKNLATYDDHTIEDETLGYTGFFGYISTGEVKNVFVKDGHVLIEDFNDYGGGIAGYLGTEGKISSCIFSGEISFGGIVDYFEGTISDCLVLVDGVEPVGWDCGGTIQDCLSGTSPTLPEEGYENWIYIEGMKYPLPKSFVWLAN